MVKAASIVCLMLCILAQTGSGDAVLRGPHGRKRSDSPLGPEPREDDGRVRLTRVQMAAGSADGPAELTPGEATGPAAISIDTKGSSSPMQSGVLLPGKAS